ncbi:hypothetical protein GGR51DRAFT_566615 [Nemania sp. FL0031]|nr:hypothetical protein GGR51DRAFT_566615 [Nemania sp. FL0031]
MKHISKHTDRLSKALNKAEELEQEVARLRKKLALLEIGKQHKLRPSTCSEKSTNNTTIENRYAQPTEASRKKDKSRITLRTSGDKLPLITRANSGSTEVYRYKDGVPIKLGTPIETPHYMKDTQTVFSRRWITDGERLAKQQLAKQQQRKQAQISQSPQISSDELWSWKQWEDYEPLPKEMPPTPPESDAGNENERVEDLETRSRLGDNLWFGGRRVTIDSKNGFKYLRRAFKIAQEAVHAVGESGAPGWRRFRGGPQTVKLGRDELMCWIGQCSPLEHSRNASSRGTIYNKLLGVVPLRNAVSHPSEETFENSQEVDEYIRLSQALAVALGDDKRAFEVRKLRDDLRDEANRSAQDLLDLYHISCLPYCPGIRCQYHHIRLFESFLGYYDYFPDPDKEEERRVLELARAWANAEDSSR